MRVATHPGPFHADEVFAIAILSLLNPDMEIIRTRDEAEFAKADLRVDVGLKNDPSTGDFDHHQPEGGGKRSNEIPYAAAGLVWKEFGRRLAPDREVWEKIDSKLIMPIDAADNGVETYKEVTLYPYTLGDVIKTFRPEIGENQDFDAAFREAVTFAKRILEREIASAKNKIESRKLVLEAIKNSPEGLLVMDAFLPWKRLAIEESTAVYAIYPSFDGAWKAHAVPTAEEGYEVRKDFPAAWAGLNDAELQKVSGVPDAIFCHRKLFLCGAKTKEGAIALARKALEN